MAQQLLFPDPQPLVERLGRDFFKNLPEVPGVYLMRDVAGGVLYVGKAKNLRRRLNSYRVANPDRLPRRHLRLLRAVGRIELRLCPNEAAALRQEAELLRTLRPKYNRAGTWPGKPRFLTCDREGEGIMLRIVESPQSVGHVIGPLGGGATALRAVLARLFWFAACPHRGIVGLPAGWIHRRLPVETVIRCGPRIGVVTEALERLFSGEVETFCEWIRTQMPPNLHPFEQAAIEADLELLAEAKRIFAGRVSIAGKLETISLASSHQE